MTRSRQFRKFCSQLLGTGFNSPLRDVEGKAINGATVSAIVEAFASCFPVVKKEQPRELPDFESELYREPWTVYAIRNLVTGEVYVGIASHGFVGRYPKGEWWIKTHHPRLKRDALSYGVRNFAVSIHVCLDRADMKRTEAAMIRAQRPATYNVKPEPDNVEVAADGDDEP